MVSHRLRFSFFSPGLWKWVPSTLNLGALEGNGFHPLLNSVPPLFTVDRVEGIEDTVVGTASDVEIFGNGFQAGFISTISFPRMIVPSDS